MNPLHPVLSQLRTVLDGGNAACVSSLDKEELRAIDPTQAVMKKLQSLTDKRL